MINYTYDANGNLVTKADARPITTTYVYDRLNRVTQRSYSDDPKVLFASISCSNRSQDSQDTLKFYTNKFLNNIDANDLPIYFDPAEFSRARLSQLMTAGGFSYPTTLVMDGEGRVVDVWRSAVPQGGLAKAIDKAKAATRAPL